MGKAKLSKTPGADDASSKDDGDTKAASSPMKGMKAMKTAIPMKAMKSMKAAISPKKAMKAASSPKKATIKKAMKSSGGAEGSRQLKAMKQSKSKVLTIKSKFAVFKPFGTLAPTDFEPAPNITQSPLLCK